MFLKYKPTKFRTHSRLPQSPKNKVRIRKKGPKFASSRFAYKSLVRT